MTRVQTITVANEDEGTRLDRWFKRHFPQVTQGQLQKLLRTKQIKVDNTKATANQRLEAGQVVRIPPLPDKPAPSWERPPMDEETYQRMLDLVIYKDKELIAVNKPAGLAVQGGSKISESLDDLLDALTFEASERPKLVHRLDRDTSGVLLLARNTQQAGKLAELFRERDVKKVYWALVKGIPRPLEGEIKLPIAKKRISGEEKMVVDEHTGLKSFTRYRVVQKLGTELAWVEMYPLTGRTHQLRVHMAAIGTPIIGDGKYGGEAAFHPNLPAQLHLHAREVVLPGKHRQDDIRIVADLPPHMQQSFDLYGLSE